MTRRTDILEALVAVIKEIDGSSPYSSNLYKNVKPKMIFWDEIKQYPLVCLTAGTEIREYLPGNFKWGYLDINIRIYTKGDNSKQQLEDIFSDIEYVLDNNQNLAFGENGSRECTDIRLLSISDDEGLLAPQSVGEMLVQIQYDAS